MAGENLLAVGNSETLPGFTISPLLLPVFLELQRRFEVYYLAIRAEAASRLSEEVGAKLLDYADKQVRAGVIRFGTKGFDECIHDHTHLPYVLWQCLKEKHPRLTEAAAALLIKDDNRMRLWKACMVAAGYSFGDSKKSEAEQSAPQSTSATSAGSLELSGTLGKTLNVSPGPK